MTETERKALALVNEVLGERGFMALTAGDGCREHCAAHEALCRTIEQHEAFRQEVSDAVEHFKRCYPGYQHVSLFDRFIITKPDPLVEIFMDAQHLDADAALCMALHTRKAIEARGGKIVWREG